MQKVDDSVKHASGVDLLAAFICLWIVDLYIIIP